MFCLYTFPLVRPAQAKIQNLTVICFIVKLIPWNVVNLSHLYETYIGVCIVFLNVKIHNHYCHVIQVIHFSMNLCNYSLFNLHDFHYCFSSFLHSFQTKNLRLFLLRECHLNSLSRKISDLTTIYAKKIPKFCCDWLCLLGCVFISF